MKRQSWKCETVGTVLTWSDRDTKQVMFRFDLSTIAESVRAKVFEYGARQILADAGAPADTMLDRIPMMRLRATTLQDGTYGTRTSLPDSDVYHACIAIGKIPADSPAARDKWRAFTAAQRRAIAAIPAVRAAMPTSGSSDADDLLADF